MRNAALLCCALWVALVGLTPAQAQELSTKQVVANLDQKAKAFTSLDAAIARVQVEHSVKAPEESGKILMKKTSGSAPRVLFEITTPSAARKTVLIDKGVGTIYFRGTNQYSSRSVGDNNEVTELLLIGFGVTSDTYGKNYAPEYKGREAVGSVQAVVLELSAQSDGAQFKKITLWLDPSSWTPLQTRVAESARAFTDFKYSNVKLNRGVADSVFKLEIPKDAHKQ